MGQRCRRGFLAGFFLISEFGGWEKPWKAFWRSIEQGRTANV